MNCFKRHFITILAVCAGIVLVNHSTLATEYTVSSDEEFNSLTLVAGDVVTWLDGTYSNQQIKWNGQVGTASDPITLKAETPGGVIFTGSSKINFFGRHLIVDGFYWKGGEGASDHIEFRKNGSNSEFGINCTIRNCAFDNLHTEEPSKSRWIVLHGSGNMVENCSFVNKLSAGAVILVELSYTGTMTPGHIIRKNYFYNITPKDAFSTNSGDCEAIRIGVSSNQAVSAQVVVEENYFKAADGENEIITNKSADNIFRHNTFRNCRGSLVLRHGARAHVEGNYFLGEGKAKSGGIRISDRDHVIINNYMQGLNNDNDIWNNGITLVGGGESSGGSGNGYQNVDNVTIVHNTIFDCDDPIFFNDRNSYDPTGVIAYNLIYSEKGDIVAGDISGTGQGMSYEGNIFGGSPIGISDVGILEGDALFSPNGETYKPSSTGIAANAAGNHYSSIVKIDIEGITRPNSDLDVGAHEVSGGNGSVIYKPITDGEVGASIGACFLGADGNPLSACGAVGDYLTVSSLSDFPDEGGTSSISISSNVDWTVSDDQEWIDLSPTSGTGFGNIDVQVSANSSTAQRTGNITVKGTGVEDRVISVIQAAYEPPTAVTGVDITNANEAIAVGGTLQLGVSISPPDATNHSVMFESDDTSVATVSENGVVTGISQGSVTVTVTTDDGGFTDQIIINVVAPSSGFNWALNWPVTATGSPDGANVPENLVDGDIDSRWSVEGFPQSAIVDLGGVIQISQTEVICYDNRAYQFIIEGAQTENGTYTTIVDRSTNTTPGTPTAPIINLVDNIEARFVRITVLGADIYNGSWVSLTELRIFGEGSREEVLATGVSLNLSNVVLEIGETAQLNATITPSYATNQKVTYSSSNSSIATVSSDGLVTAISEGTATITVTTDDGGATASAEITVPSLPVLNTEDNPQIQVRLSPNPTTSIVTIDGVGHFHTVLVYDQTGKLIMRRKTGDGISLDVSELQAGLYLINFQGDHGNHVSRLIKY